MAHNLENRNGKWSFVENGMKERAWHGLGQVYDGAIPVREALKLSQADYHVSMHPVAAITPEIMDALELGTLTTDMILDAMIQGRTATVRDDNHKALGIVSDRYGIVQNEDAFKFVDTLCSGELADKEHTPVIETAGVLGNGERVFVTARFPEKIRLDNKGNDMVDMNMVFTTSHDGSGAVQCVVTPVRVVCNNTLNMALANCSGRLSLRHTSGVTGRLDLLNKENADFAYRALNLFDVYQKSLEAQLQHLRNIRVTDKMLDSIVAQLTLSETNLEVYQKTGNLNHKDITTRGRNLYNGMMDAIHGGIGQLYGKTGTGLWVVNGITTYFQNDAKYKDNTAKMDSIMQGMAKLKLQKAYDMLMAV